MANKDMRLPILAGHRFVIFDKHDELFSYSISQDLRSDDDFAARSRLLNHAAPMLTRNAEFASGPAIMRRLPPGASKVARARSASKWVSHDAG